MKSTGTMIGGTLQPAYYNACANYFVKSLQGYAAEGLAVDYISLQNEPLYVPTNYPGMSLPAADELSVLKSHVLPALQAAGLKTRVLVYDHNWDNTGYAATVLGDTTVAASPRVAGTAWHWYGGPPGAMTAIHNQWPLLDQFVTEASGGTWVTDEVKQDFEMIIHSLRNWARSYVKWGLALDDNRGPSNGGCNTCTPLVTVTQDAGEVSYPIDYYTLGHFSKFIRPGAVRLWTNNLPGLISVAFANPDGGVVLVVYNDSDTVREFVVAARGGRFGYILPALAGATFVWQPAHTAQQRSRLIERAPWAVAPHPYVIQATDVIEASSYNAVNGLQSESSSDAGGGFDLGYAAVGSWARYDHIDFGAGVGGVDLRLASGSAGGTLELRLDRVDGPPIATVTIPPTGDWQKWTTVSAPVAGATGVLSLYAVYTAAAGSGGIGNLNWFQFHQ
jgi:glucosylceramidase